MPSPSTHPGIELLIEEDGALAKLVLWPEVADATLNAESLTAYIRERQVLIEPSLRELLEHAIQRFKQNRVRSEIIIARAREPIHGRDGRLTWQPGCNPNQSPTASHTPDGKIDYYSQTHYVAVTAGTHLANIEPPVPGTDGYDITGKPRKAKAGNPLQVKSDSTITVTQDGKLIAAANGVVQCKTSMIRILPMFEVPGSVNFATGNIFFKGSIIIRGDVCDRFIVHAAEDLTVQGLIGSATVICGRTLNASCGMAAHERGCLFVGGNANVGYLKNVHGIVQGFCQVRRELINCDLAVVDELVCSDSSVIGGSITVGKKAVIGTLGSPKGTATLLAFGAHPCQEQVRELLAKQTVDGPDQAADAHSTSAQLAEIGDQVRQCAGQACEFVIGKTRPVDLIITKALHPGVTIKTGRLRVVIGRTLHGPLHIQGDHNNGLTCRMGDGVMHPLTELARAA